MEPIATPAAPVQPAPPVPPGVQASPAPATPPMPAPAAEPSQKMGSGGIVGFFKSLDWVEAGLLIAGFTAVFLSIRFYINEEKNNKKNSTEISDRLNGVENKLNMVISGRNKTMF